MNEHLFGSHFARNSIHAFLAVINGFLSGQFIGIVEWESKLTPAKYRIVQDHAVTIERIVTRNARLSGSPLDLTAYLARVGQRRLVSWLMNLRGPSNR